MAIRKENARAARITNRDYQSATVEGARGAGQNRQEGDHANVMLDLAGVAHDLRAPLAAIEQLVRVVLTEHLGPLSEKQRQALHSVLRRCVDLENLIGSVLDLARSETGRLVPVFGPVELEEVVAASVERLRYLQEHRHLTVQVDGLSGIPEVFADRDMLERVVTNVLSNAMKVSPHGGTVRVRAQLASLTHVRLEIQDEGPGMTAEEVREVLRPFVRGTASAGGVGLGLAIVRRLLKAQHARLTISTAPGHGTTVGIMLLRHAPPALIRRFAAQTAADLNPVAAQIQLPDPRTLRVAQGIVAEAVAPHAVVIPDPSHLTLTVICTDKGGSSAVQNAAKRLADLSGQPITVQWLDRRELLACAHHRAAPATPARNAELSKAG